MAASSSSLIWDITHVVVNPYCRPPPLICNPSRRRRRRQSLCFGSSGRGGGFIGGFVLGGILAGTLTCIYAPQISEALMGPTSNGFNSNNNNKNKLPQFAHDKDEEEEEADDLGNKSNQNPPEVVHNEEEITRESIEAKIAEINAIMGGNPPNPRYN